MATHGSFSPRSGSTQDALRLVVDLSTATNPANGSVYVSRRLGFQDRAFVITSASLVVVTPPTTATALNLGLGINNTESVSDIGSLTGINAAGVIALNAVIGVASDRFFNVTKVSGNVTGLRAFVVADITFLD